MAKKGDGFLRSLILILLAVAAVFVVLRRGSPTGSPNHDTSGETLGDLIEELTDFLPTEGTGFAAEQQQEMGSLGKELQFPAETYFYFQLLTEKQQAVYRQVYANVLEFRSEFSMVNALPPADLELVMESLRYDHPEIFWMTNSYQYGYNADDLAVSLILSFACTAEEYPAMAKQFEAAAEEILAEAQKLPTPVEQERYIHDYLVEHCSYHTDPARGQSAYSALVERKSVCAGYSSAFQYLMIRLGIPCYYCPGTASGGSHAWNILLLDGEAYHVDLTWDDPVTEGEPLVEGKRYYNYFNLTDEQISVTHVRAKFVENLPACQSEAASFSNSFSPDPTDLTLSYYRTAASLGLQQEIIVDRDSFYKLCREKMIAADGMSAKLLFAAQSKAVADLVVESINTQEFTDQCLYRVAEARDFFGCSYTADLTSEEMSDGRYLMVFSYEFIKE